VKAEISVRQQNFGLCLKRVKNANQGRNRGDRLPLYSMHLFRKDSAKLKQKAFVFFGPLGPETRANDEPWSHRRMSSGTRKSVQFPLHFDGGGE
jgi:hypothetical protein